MKKSSDYSHMRHIYNKRHRDKRKAAGLPSQDPKYNLRYYSKIRGGYENSCDEKPGEECQLCRNAYSNMKHRANFDHCHGCGKFRGWICGSCNRALGLAKDNIETLERMIAYLKQHKDSCSEF